MPESDPARRFLTRRRVIAGAMFMVGILSIVLLFVWSRGSVSRPPIGVSFRGFEQVVAEKSPGSYYMATAAVLALTNYSNTSFDVFTPDGGTSVVGRISVRIPEGLSMAPLQFPAYNAGSLEPHGSRTVKVRLPEDGSIGKAEVLCANPPVIPQGYLRRAVYEVKRFLKPDNGVKWAACEQEVQCPLRRPDGKLEPARLVPKGESNGR